MYTHILYQFNGGLYLELITWKTKQYGRGWGQRKRNVRSGLWVWFVGVVYGCSIREY